MKILGQNLSKVDEIHILDNSIERVINNTIRCLEKARQTEDVSIALQDWNDLKWIVVNLWNGARNEVFKERQK